MPEALAAPRGGLFTKEDTPVPLAGVAIEADISTLCARVTVFQRYVNRETKPIEAIYVFPLDEGAAVCGFEAIIDGTLVVGEVQEREAAFKIYDEAMEQGHGAYLLDEERPDVFQASVGNLPPGKEVLVKLTYVTELSIADGVIRFAIPTTVSPRYAPAEDRVGVGRPDSETLNPPLAWRVPYGLELTIRVAMTGAIARVESASHPISIAVDGQNATVRLSQREAAFDRDFVLSVEAAGLDTPHGWIEREDDGTETIGVAFVPAFRDTSAPAEVVFLVDRSGSMGGQSIAEVRNALQLCLRSMISGCAFNIVGFGSKFEALFKTNRAYDEQSLAEASEHVAGLDADLGGTEILPALKFVLEQERHAELPRQVVVLTDGEVTNTDAVLALAAEHAREARIFTFGIGASASHHLVKGLARAGGGVAEFIYPGERIESKVVRQFGRLLSPALTDVRIDWQGADVTQAPSTILPVFSGGRLLVYGFVTQRRGGDVPVRARLSAQAPSGPVAFDVDIVAAGVRAGQTVAALAARTRIRELEESPAWTKTRGSRQSDRKQNAVTQEIVALSTRYRVISRETSFVAIERRETPVEGDVQLRRVPIALAAGWGGLDQPVHQMQAFRFSGQVGIATGDAADEMLALPVSATPPAAGPWDIERMKAGGARMLSRDSMMRMRPEISERGAVGDCSASPEKLLYPGRPPEAEDPIRHRMQIVVKLQHADGSWELTEELADTIGRDRAELRSALGSPEGLLRDFPRIWATALALAWLDRHAGHLESEWTMVADKGRRWLNDALREFSNEGRWVHEAMRYLRS